MAGDWGETNANDIHCRVCRLRHRNGCGAQEFPEKPVTLMMPYAAGGPGDTITRVIGQGMSKVLGRQFLVENTAGAGGTIGSAKIAASPPDGYALLVMHFGHAANTAL
jgi:tripartite-type tricarboxylate transporter receptor subunit TctC